VRAPVDHIAAPAFPAQARWLNVTGLRMDQQRGRPVLIEFWDFCRPNSIRTLPYLRAWDERYRDQGLRVIGVHSPGFAPSADPDNVAAAVQRLGIEYPVLVDSELEVFAEYDNLGWPARYLFNQDGRLFEYHFGEGAYQETERAIAELLGIDAEPLEPIRPEDQPDVPLVAQSDDVPGPYSGPYEAGGVWAVLDTPFGAQGGAGVIVANGVTIEVDHPGAYELIRHPVSTVGTLELAIGEGVTCHAVCFTPGLAP
jgi:thiol-disulfide isomerase/thioredoxin